MKKLDTLNKKAELSDQTQIDDAAVKKAILELLTALGEDHTREGLVKTPERVALMYHELLEGYHTNPDELLNDALFDLDYHEMVIVRDIEFYSLCEHHLLPFMGRAHVAYLPKGKVIGLSKIPRVIEMFSRRLQVQERLTQQIAVFLDELIQPDGVAVVVEALHLCSMMRGVKKQDARMTTSVMRGKFQKDANLRMEFLQNISRSAEPLHI
jgi:GTP cyclohydrolase I